MQPTNQMVALAQLKPHPQNYNRHPAEQVKRLAKSLSKFGQVRSVVVWRGTILAGHGVVEAARSLKWESARADVLPDDYPEELALAYVAADNELAKQGDPDLAQLAAILEQSRAADAELLEAIGYSDAEFEALLKEVGQSNQATSGDTEPQIDRAEELRQKWGVESGQLWQLGEHRLICGDCTDAAIVARVMGGERAQLIVTSPPYNQNIDTFKLSGMQKENPSFVNRMASSYVDSMPEDEYQAWQKQLLRLWLDFVTGNASCFYNHKIRYRDKRILPPLDWLTDCGWSIRQEIIWDRGSSITLNARMFIPADERIYWLRAGDDFVFNDTAEIKAWSTVWKVGAKNDVSISAAFATEIPTRCIAAASSHGDIVAEPFSGSGTTLIACENLSRRCRAVEISPAYVAVALERWHVHTGKTPELVSNG